MSSTPWPAPSVEDPRAQLELHAQLVAEAGCAQLAHSRRPEDVAMCAQARHRRCELSLHAVQAIRGRFVVAQTRSHGRQRGRCGGRRPRGRSRRGTRAGPSSDGEPHRSKAASA